MSAQMKHSKGFTIVELVMAMAVGLVLLAAISTAVVSGQRSSTGIERKVTTNQDARAALEIMATEIRMASFSPYMNSAPGGAAPLTWLNPADCSAGTQLNRGIQLARDGEIVVEMDIQGACAPSVNVNDSCSDASINKGSSSEIIRYLYDDVNQRINREEISCNAGARSPQALLSFLGPIAGQPEVRTVRVTNGTTLPVFRYFKADGTPLNPAGTPMTDAKIIDIKRIEIVLLVESADVDPSTGQPRRMAYSTSVIPRNHCITGF
jgi:prepilin-type N-terminal cleavage/methylation domain-containing protein